jgi:hypothetical protein
MKKVSKKSAPVQRRLSEKIGGGGRKRTYSDAVFETAELIGLLPPACRLVTVQKSAVSLRLMYT